MSPTPTSTPTLPALRGAMLALAAAVLFGISTPLVQHFSAGVGGFATAALLYAGAAAIGATLRRPADQEARVQRGDWGRIAAMAAFGAVVGPVALVWGLQHTSGTSASLMLTLEAVFTAGLAWLLYRETVDRRVAAAMALLVLGGMALVMDGAQGGATPALGLAAVAVATVAWGVDNTLSRGVASRDPGQVILFKSVLGAAAAAAMASLTGQPLPSAAQALALLAIGATGYGLSLRFYLLAQRAFGAARTGSVFAFAPFIGAAVALALGERAGGPWLAAGAGLMLAGIGLHLAERHHHEHEHLPLEHEHAHRHDDGHHLHHHDVMPVGAHSHRHRHGWQRHAHAHVPDEHHTHSH